MVELHPSESWNNIRFDSIPLYLAEKCLPGHWNVLWAKLWKQFLLQVYMEIQEFPDKWKIFLEVKSAFKLLVTLKCWYMWECSHMEFRCVLSEEGILNKSSINSPLPDWVALHIKHEADFDLQCPLWGCLMPGNFCWVSHAFVYDLSLRDLQDCIFQ